MAPDKTERDNAPLTEEQNYEFALDVLRHIAIYELNPKARIEAARTILAFSR